MAAPNLTARQKQVLGLLKDGKTPAQIAKQLKMSANGVYQHRRRLEERGLITKAQRTTGYASNGSGNGRSEEGAAGVYKATVPSNGLLVETAKVLDERVGTIEEALKENMKGREITEKEIHELEERQMALKADAAALESAESALNEARAKVTA